MCRFLPSAWQVLKRRPWRCSRSWTTRSSCKEKLQTSQRTKHTDADDGNVGGQHESLRFRLKLVRWSSLCPCSFTVKQPAWKAHRSTQLPFLTAESCCFRSKRKLRSRTPIALAAPALILAANIYIYIIYILILGKIAFHRGFGQVVSKDSWCNSLLKPLVVDPALESIDWLAPSTQQQLQGHLLAPEPSSCDCMSSWLKIFSASKSFLSQIPPPKRLEVLQDGALVSSSWGPQLPSAKNQPIAAWKTCWLPGNCNKSTGLRPFQLHSFRMLQGWLRGPKTKIGSHTHPKLNVQRPGIYKGNIVGSSASGRKFAWDNVMSSSPGFQDHL